jgi:CheY-like chemotaxis protein
VLVKGYEDDRNDGPILNGDPNSSRWRLRAAPGPYRALCVIRIKLQPDRQAARPPSALLVDADASVRALVTTILEQGGFEVRAVDDGEAAISELDAWRPDLVVTNLRLQNMSGDDLIGYLHADRSLAGIPIMVVSAYLDSIELDHTPDAVIQKPFNPQELLHEAFELLERSRDGR